jgi:hypothetical protein
VKSPSLATAAIIHFHQYISILFQIVEFDKPSALLANKDSLFGSLVAATEKSHQNKSS